MCKAHQDDPPGVKERAPAATGQNPWWTQPDWTTAKSAQWACADCISSGRAITSSPDRQRYCCWPPYLAYFDTSHTCVDCKNAFIFPKEEQQFWYEELGFLVQSRPIRCRECRARRRAQVRVNSAIQAAVRSVDKTDPKQLGALAMLYVEADNTRKAEQYLRMAKNRARGPSERAELLQQLKDLEKRAR